MKGQCFEGFSLESGVRQGCPLSPVLFVLAIDILLRRLQRMFPAGLPRAFADDNAMVVENFQKDGPGILGVYREFAAFSGLNLNVPKTVVVPLWLCNLDQLKLLMDTEQVAKRARAHKYLVSFANGPKI